MHVYAIRLAPKLAGRGSGTSAHPLRERRWCNGLILGLICLLLQWSTAEAQSTSGALANAKSNADSMLVSRQPLILPFIGGGVLAAFGKSGNQAFRLAGGSLEAGASIFVRLYSPRAGVSHGLLLRPSAWVGVAAQRQPSSVHENRAVGTLGGGLAVGYEWLGTRLPQAYSQRALGIGLAYRIGYQHDFVVEMNGDWAHSGDIVQGAVVSFSFLRALVGGTRIRGPMISIEYDRLHTSRVNELRVSVGRGF